MAQRNETDGGTAFVSPIVLVDSDTEVLGTIDAGSIFKSIDVEIDCSAGGTAQTTAVGTVPAGSVIFGVVATVVEPFNGNATETFEVGVAGNTDKYIDPVDFDADGAVGTTVFSATGTNNDQKVLEYATAAIPIIATWTNTAAATDGIVRVQVLYR